jgi:Putative Ig domain/FG-GAP-like repeat
MAISTVNITNKQNAGEPATQGAFSIVRTGDLTQQLTVKINTISQLSLLDSASSSYATPGEDYQVLPTTVTFAAGQSSLDLPVISIDDTIPENTQTVKVSIVADAAYTLGTSQTATVLITDNDLVATIPATGINKTATEAGYTIKKLSSNTIAGFSKISGNLVVWQEGTGATSTLRLFDGNTTKTLSTETSNVYKSYNLPAFVYASNRVDNGKVVWGQFVDEALGGYQVPVYHTFLDDGTTTTDLGKTTGADFAGDRIAWATAGGINIYRISDKSNTLVPGAKDVTNLVIDSDKSIVWNENTRGTSLSGVSAQTLRFYDGTKIVDLVTLPAGQDAYTQPAIVTAAVSGSKVVYLSKGDLYLYNNGQSTKIAESVLDGSFGINGDRVFYQAKELNSSLVTERSYSISSGKTENPIENNFGTGVTIRSPNTDGKNNTWLTTQPTLITGSEAGTKANLYIDDGTTRVNLATSGPSVIENLIYTAVSGANVIYDTFTPATVNDPSSGKIALYLASKSSSPNTPVNNPPVVANPISAQSIVSGSPLNFSLAANTFTDPDAGDVLSYSAKLNNGSNLPTWLTFDAVTRTFAGTPAAGDVGNFGIVVTATDKAGLAVTNSFGLNVTTANKPAVTGEKADILWRNDYGSVALWQMDGATVTNVALTSIQSVDPSWTVAGTSDFNGDGKSDILWRNTSGAVDIWQMDGSKVVSSSLTSIALLDNSWKAAGTGDFNGDGKSDILWRNDDGAVVVWTMNGSTVTSSKLTSTPSLDQSWKVAGTGDFSGDGQSDILWRNDDGSIALWQMNGSTVIASTSTSTPSLDGSWKINGTGDFNGDGKADILWSNSKTGAMAIWQMNGAQVLSSSLVSSPLPDSSWRLGGIGDFNGDGKSDVLWRNTNNAVAIWQMNGAQVVSSSLTSSPTDSSHWKVAGVVI